ncbi:hypothetical protein MNBD_GAMMA26-2282 [hydrothermal vent metagenome]|uniref:Glycosyltransferase 2-like domain-containing protein n=1 Tax=hydrothermal vent metagenome TaxID=652676 RepID=A0A3B1B4M9_9ZZZZ
MQTITVIIPVYNEYCSIKYNLPFIISEACKVKDIKFCFLLIDDGSTDKTATWISEYCEQRDNIELLCLSRNFGKEAAIHAGLDHARGNAVIIMDSDLQHPPVLIPKMVKLWRQGIDVVEACKSSRGRETFSNRLLATGFYRIFNLLVGMDIKNRSDYKLLDRKIVDIYCSLPERKRFFRGLIGWMGFSSAQVFFDVPVRQHGISAWSRIKLMRFSMTALTSFSSTPLHLITGLGISCFALSLVIGGIALYDKYSGQAVSGFTTVILLILLIGSLIMFGLGLIGVYIEQVFDEIKQRPTYLVDQEKSHIREDS